MRLNAWNMSDGTVEIHKAGCSHNPASGRKNSRMQDQVDFGETDYASKAQYGYDYWNNGILEESEHDLGVGTFDIFAEMDFKPCTKSLRVGSREEIDGTAEDKAIVDAVVKDAKLGQPAEIPARNSIETRKEGRRHLLIAMIAERDNVLTYDRKLAESMTEQIARVNHMFGFDNEPGWAV